MGGGCRLLFMGPDAPRAGGGFEPVWIPLISVEPVWGSSARLLSSLGEGSVIVFTSPRGPRLLAMDAIASRAYDRVAEAIRGSTVAVVGPSTLQAVRTYLGEPARTIMPRVYTVRWLAEELARLRPRRAISLRASNSSPALGEVLGREGIPLSEVVVYRNEPLHGNAPVAAGLIEDGRVDYALFTSPLQARLVAPLLSSPRAGVLAIGPETGRMLSEYGVSYGAPATPNMGSLVSLALERC